MDQHPGELPPDLRSDLIVFCTPSGHRLLVPRTAAGVRYVLDEIESEPGRLLPCLLLPADSSDDSIFDEMDEDGLRWRRKCASPRGENHAPSAVSPPELDGPPPRRPRRTRVS